MKKYIATFLSCALLLSSFSFSFALEDIEHTEAKPDTLTVEEIQALSNLPIFITTIKSDNIDKENIGELIDSIQNSPIAFHNSPSDSNQKTGGRFFCPDTKGRGTPYHVPFLPPTRERHSHTTNTPPSAGL